jgi:hypothetical protein
MNLSQSKKACMPTSHRRTREMSDLVFKGFVAKLHKVFFPLDALSTQQLPLLQPTGIQLRQTDKRVRGICFLLHYAFANLDMLLLTAKLKKCA